MKQKANVHAEAALMSLASRDDKLEVHVDGTLTPIANLLPVSDVRLVYCLEHTIHLSISVRAYPDWGQQAMLLLLLVAG